MSNSVKKTQVLDARFILLVPSDNVVVAREQIDAGESIQLEDALQVTSELIRVGFKVARREIKQGEIVVKCGAAIGSATAKIEAGSAVHTHNMKSDYMPTYTHDEGARFTKRVDD